MNKYVKNQIDWNSSFFRLIHFFEIFEISSLIRKLIYFWSLNRKNSTKSSIFSKTKKDIEKSWYIIVKNILMNKYVKNQIDWNSSFLD